MERGIDAQSGSKYRDLGGNLIFLRRNVIAECGASFAYLFFRFVKTSQSANLFIIPPNDCILSCSSRVLRSKSLFVPIITVKPRYQGGFLK